MRTIKEGLCVLSSWREEWLPSAGKHGRRRARSGEEKCRRQAGRRGHFVINFNGGRAYKLRSDDYDTRSVPSVYITFVVNLLT